MYGDSAKILNHYVIKDNPIDAEMGGDKDVTSEALSKDQYQLMKTVDTTIYFIGYILYKDLITKHNRLYKFRIEMKCKTGASGQLFVNGNDDISEAEYKKLVPNW
jgi:hypothetical protein